ncbi:MAG: hypothetical protein WCC41_04530 [Rhodomicrobium sp.]
MIKECAYDGELALKIAVEVLEAGDIRRLSGEVDVPAFGAAIKAAAARLSAKHHDRDYESERVTGYAHGILLRPQDTVNDLDDEIEWKTTAAETLQRYADRRHKSRQEDE